jgi:hypothetical protein
LPGVILLFVGLAVVLGVAWVATGLSERPNEVAGRSAPMEQSGRSDSSTAQDPTRSTEQQRHVPGLPKN